VLDSIGQPVMVDSPDCAYDQIAKGLTMVSTIDFFYPLVDDPYNQGMIGAANVLSDLYSCGVTEIPTVLMILSASTQMKKPEQLIVTKLMMKGFADKVREAGSRIGGGQSVLNEFPMIGGAAFGLVRSDTPYVPKHAKPCDVLVITKPLGSQILVNVNQYYMNKDEKFKTLFEEKKLIKDHQIEDLYQQGLHYMAQLNKVACELMLKHGATSSTDVTGFGILGHSQNLAEVQTAEVDYLIEKLPCYPVLHSLDKIVRDFKFKQGLAAETSGGLLISFPPDKVDAFIENMHKAKRGAWKVGKITKGTRKAKLAENLEILEVN
jgi:selenide,water dikinase